MFLRVSVSRSVHRRGAIPAHIAGVIPACLAVGGAIPAYIAGVILACLAAGLGACSRGDACSRGMPDPGGACSGGWGWRPLPESRRLLLHTVCILLECIIVHFKQLSQKPTSSLSFYRYQIFIVHTNSSKGQLTE